MKKSIADRLEMLLNQWRVEDRDLAPLESGDESFERYRWRRALEGRTEELEEALHAKRECRWCHREFPRNGKQVYCTVECSRHARWARFVQRRPPRDYRAEREKRTSKRTA